MAVQVIIFSAHEKGRHRKEAKGKWLREFEVGWDGEILLQLAEANRTRHKILGKYLGYGSIRNC